MKALVLNTLDFLLLIYGIIHLVFFFKKITISIVIVTLMNETWAMVHCGICCDFFRSMEMGMCGLDAMIPFSGYT